MLWPDHPVFSVIPEFWFLDWHEDQYIQQLRQLPAFLVGEEPRCPYVRYLMQLQAGTLVELPTSLLAEKHCHCSATKEILHLKIFDTTEKHAAYLGENVGGGQA